MSVNKLIPLLFSQTTIKHRPASGEPFITDFYSRCGINKNFRSPMICGLLGASIRYHHPIQSNRAKPETVPRRNWATIKSPKIHPTTGESKTLIAFSTIQIGAKMGGNFDQGVRVCGWSKANRKHYVSSKRHGNINLC